MVGRDSSLRRRKLERIPRCCSPSEFFRVLGPCNGLYRIVDSPEAIGHFNSIRLPLGRDTHGIENTRGAVSKGFFSLVV